MDIFGVEIFKTGRWNGDDYNAGDLDEMVRNFDRVGFRPPLKIGHDEKSGDRSFGWIGRIYRKGEKLVADFVDLPKKVYDLIREKAYDAVSSEIFWNLERNGKTFRRALKAVALLGAETPAVSDLAPVSNNLSMPAGMAHTYTFKRTEDNMSRNRDFIEEERALAKEFNEAVGEIALRHNIPEGEAFHLFSRSAQYRQLGARGVELQNAKLTAYHSELSQAYAASSDGGKIETYTVYGYGPAGPTRETVRTKVDANAASQHLHEYALSEMEADEGLSYSEAVDLALFEYPETALEYCAISGVLKKYSPSAYERDRADEAVAEALADRSDQKIHEAAIKHMTDTGSDDYSAAVHFVMAKNAELTKQYRQEVGVRF